MGRLYGLISLCCVAAGFLWGCNTEISMPPGGPVAEWPVYGRDEGGSRYSPLTQITRDNVKYLKVAWTYRTGDVSNGTQARATSAFQAMPILVEGTLYVCSPFNHVIALDPETGAERWTFDPKIDLSAPYANQLICRLREDGKQYVVIAAGGHGRMGTTLGDYVVAFALP